MPHTLDQAKEIELLVTLTKRRTDLLVEIGLESARAGDINQMERSTSGLKDTIKNPKLPREFVNTIIGQIKDIELLGYRKYIDSTLPVARRAALAHDHGKKAALLRTVRECLLKAISAGAGEQFRRDTMRVVEIVEFTG